MFFSMENLQLLQKIVHDQVLLKIWSIHLRNIMEEFDPKKLEIIKDIFNTINTSRGLSRCLFKETRHTTKRVFVRCSQGETSLPLPCLPPPHCSHRDSSWKDPAATHRSLLRVITRTHLHSIAFGPLPTETRIP